MILISWGYEATGAGRFGESAGWPLPGETVLMFAGFLAHQHTRFIFGLGTIAGPLSGSLENGVDGIFQIQHRGLGDLDLRDRVGRVCLRQ